eukprot:TRINITY_DN6135_c0_g1_i1.p1 TRINITY_DN6135_c0_g1~~TRINITY_DN6135_c0_g1_i1.p1  ORF type:complete len:123 (-),score=22.80 TRINITY_DN6135_c0_g1_i1:61-390(-)
MASGFWKQIADRFFWVRSTHLPPPKFRVPSPNDHAAPVMPHGEHSKLFNNRYYQRDRRQAVPTLTTEQIDALVQKGLPPRQLPTWQRLPESQQQVKDFFPDYKPSGTFL